MSVPDPSPRSNQGYPPRRCFPELARGAVPQPLAVASSGRISARNRPTQGARRGPCRNPWPSNAALGGRGGPRWRSDRRGAGRDRRDSRCFSYRRRSFCSRKCSIAAKLPPSLQRRGRSPACERLPMRERLEASWNWWHVQLPRVAPIARAVRADHHGRVGQALDLEVGEGAEALDVDGLDGVHGGLSIARW